MERLPVSALPSVMSCLSPMEAMALSRTCRGMYQGVLATVSGEKVNELAKAVLSIQEMLPHLASSLSLISRRLSIAYFLSFKGMQICLKCIQNDLFELIASGPYVYKETRSLTGLAKDIIKAGCFCKFALGRPSYVHGSRLPVEAFLRLGEVTRLLKLRESLNIQMTASGLFSVIEHCLNHGSIKRAIGLHKIFPKDDYERKRVYRPCVRIFLRRGLVSECASFIKTEKLKWMRQELFDQLCVSRQCAGSEDFIPYLKHLCPKDRAGFVSRLEANGRVKTFRFLSFQLVFWRGPLAIRG
ncbi:MAG: hypothetical protein MRY21_04550 [Simkaniaceae bacterium]|nr:hypothetical protein [Simkaniaceae bacterium]